MELTKYGHAGVSLERDGQRLVLDPGVYTDASALDGASAVLITHEHADHFLEERIRAALEASPEFEVWTNAAVAASLEGFGPRVHVVGAGDAFTAAGFEVRVYGEWHAEIHQDIPRVRNVGFLVEESVFHPGDALIEPQAPVDTLLVPVHAPWSKMAEVVDWVRELKPARTFGMHDVLLSDIGLGMMDRFLGEHGLGTGAVHRRLGVNERVSLA
jgi:L-ascorbate metabolism protein UlaG (beta-lactamase superfamily)